MTAQHDAIRYASIAKAAVNDRDEATQRLVHELRADLDSVFSAVGKASSAGERPLDVLLGALIQVHRSAAQRAKEDAAENATRLLAHLADSMKRSVAKQVEQDIAKWSLELQREI